MLLWEAVQSLLCLIIKCDLAGPIFADMGPHFLLFREPKLKIVRPVAALSELRRQTSLSFTYRLDEVIPCRYVMGYDAGGIARIISE